MSARVDSLPPVRFGRSPRRGLRDRRKSTATDFPAWPRSGAFEEPEKSWPLWCLRLRTSNCACSSGPPRHALADAPHLLAKTRTLDDVIHVVSRSPPGLLPIFRWEHQLRLLGHLYVHAGRGYSVADLVRETGIPQATVSREVDRLVRAGLLVTSRSGRMKLVEANAASAFFPELRALLLKSVGPLALLRQRLGRIRGVQQAHIFGSWARRYEGEIGPPPADVDVIVVGDADPDAVDAACAAVGRRLGLEVNAIVLTRSEWESSRSGFVRQVRRRRLVPILEEAK